MIPDRADQPLRIFVEAADADLYPASAGPLPGKNGQRGAYGSNCKVKLTAIDKLKPSSNGAKSHEGTITA
jgi:hypothetical protein